MKTLQTGSLAYYDSFAGLIPCKVLDIKIPRDIADSATPSTSIAVRIEFTSGNRAYHRGETLTASALHVIPRDAVRIRDGQYRIGAYQVAR